MSIPAFAALNPGYEEKRKERSKEAERRQTQECKTPCQRARRRATEKAACAALPLSGALACRRSTAALPKGCVVPWCDPGQAS